ncbi:low-density lipoprotein receptor-related protein 2 [Aplysia californica]|uniref:Low-density lipoprotein receptor-related protein 2 n=1 Tax=Aplysia californica TaxID=6500 RepID=A0ABM0ZWR4_APLCA|nr:low-density lipoprotein receptor-related protein 2 [Aplysia californica]
MNCLDDEFACSDRCIETSWVCDGEYDCPDSSDEQNCPIGCSGSNKFICDNGDCIPTAYRCDGDNDCGDDTDERNCPEKSTCKADQFMCNATRKCIPDSWKCDFQNDCDDNSDELGCPSCSGPTVFQCNNTGCIHSSYYCDGDDDCGDNSDEENCPCATDEFTCKSGECIGNRYHCDGEFDCNDNSDETDCPDIHPAACGDKLTLSDCAHMNVTSYPICLYEDDAFKYCREFCGLCIQNSTNSTISTISTNSTISTISTNSTDTSIILEAFAVCGNHYSKEHVRMLSSLWKTVCVSLLVAAVVQDCTAKGIKDAKKSKMTGASLKRAVSCQSDEFACTDRCIDSAWHCDSETDCPDGSDESGCPTGCSGSNKISCANGQCVPAAYACDGDDDCGDLTDERNCAAVTCQGHQFRCNISGFGCIPDSWKCDGDNDCGDNSDEIGCSGSCSANRFQCANTVCVYSSYICDGDDDCGDNSDETGCTCSSNEFTCKSGACIPKKYQCDGEFDCNDNSDERSCPDIHPGACGDKLTLADCIHMNSTTYPICQFEDDAFKYCREFCGLCDQS